MDYQFENLGPERFQDFCQALLVKSVRAVQCFPVGQADGGRDAIASLEADDKESFAVYQVKFVRTPSNVIAPHRWLTDVLKEEVPKLSRLLPKGASAYYLLTNVRGTGAATVGSIDAVDTLLREGVPVPAQCWWRDDLSRRLEAAADLKWSFPELFTGTDLLRVLIEHGLQADQQRRSAAITTFVRTQHDREQEVRFKQVELQNKLVDLFVDVPVAVPQPLEEVGAAVVWKRVLEHHRLEDGGDTVGAATFLLNPLLENCFRQIVLEGAPGQGKSTITQYVCQVHRMRLLSEHVELMRVSDIHKQGSLKLPIRADLRDYATWLGRQDPFALEPPLEPPAEWHKSLDAFLAALIRHESGGVDFSVSDLHETMRVSAVLIVLDGLDEIADIHKRQLVISEVQTACARLREVAASLQVVVTSRPAAFANSPGFAAAQFPHIQLVALTRPLIDTYADRWLQARKLHGREAKETLAILSVKLKQPHLLALAKNPMQLAILLSLIHTRGASLPDKRTSLYDNYVDLFFSREAEKSSIVRDHRDLLTDIHGYLGWVLHTAAEKGSHSGSITNVQLKELLREYLRSEARDPQLADTLFAGMVERVVFLVSRVEGTVEFEVQPLREYFAARYLYETAPYSPTGAEKRGTKPDRFDGIARNFYWLNVTRFYAGCFSKGELPALVDRIQELQNTGLYRVTGYPRRLAAMLLADWVFSQHQRSTQEAVSLVVGGLVAGDVVSASQRLRRQHLSGMDDPMILPDGCGRREMVATCTRLLSDDVPMDFASELIDTLKNNSADEEIDQWWRAELPTHSGYRLTKWLVIGSRCGALKRCRTKDLRAAQQSELAKAENLDVLIEAGQAEFVIDSRSLTQSWFDGWRAGNTRSRHWLVGPDVLSQLLFLTDASLLSAAFVFFAPQPLSEVVAHTAAVRFVSFDRSRVYKSPELRRCKDFVEFATGLWTTDASDWARSLGPWNELVEMLRRSFGESTRALEVAVLAANARGSAADADGDLLDASLPLCERMRVAKVNARSHRWWNKHLESAANRFDKLTVLSAFVAWAGDATVLRLRDRVSAVLDSLDGDTWDALVRITSVYWMNTRRTKRVLNVVEVPLASSPRFFVLLANRLSERQEVQLYLRALRDYGEQDGHVVQFCVRNAIAGALARELSWDTALEIVRQAYRRGIVGDHVLRRQSPSALRRFPVTVAQRIMQSSRDYSRGLVQYAVERCRLEAANRAAPLIDVARQDDWFGERLMR